MKSIILAAGKGSRLRPLTNEVPKCMVQYNDQCIIDYILDSMESAGLSDNIIVHGYKGERLIQHLSKRSVRFYANKLYDRTNMLHTLFCAEKELDDDIIISYADIIYGSNVLKRLMNSNSDIACVVDLKWKELWQQRMENPLDDAESMKINDSGYIVELGKRTDTHDDINGQYIGLIKISKNVIADVITFYHSLDHTQSFDGRDFDNMYMTSFLQLIIDELMPVKAVTIEGGWLEIDEFSDLECTVV